MTQKEFETRKNEIKNSRMMLISMGKKEVETFVEETLGKEWMVFFFDSRGFKVGLHDEGKQIFGCSFDVYSREEWHTDDNGKLRSKLEVSVNIGTCGSFEVNRNENQEKLYIGFGKFLTAMKERHFDESLLNFTQSIIDKEKEYRKLEELFNSNDKK